MRELRNVLERAVLLQPGPEIRFPEFLAPAALPAASFPAHQEQETDTGTLSLDEIGREHIRAALDAHGENYSRTARAIGISLSTLKRKIKKYGSQKVVNEEPQVRTMLLRVS